MSKNLIAAMMLISGSKRIIARFRRAPKSVDHDETESLADRVLLVLEQHRHHALSVPLEITVRDLGRRVGSLGRADLERALEELLARNMIFCFDMSGPTHERGDLLFVDELSLCSDADFWNIEVMGMSAP